MEHDAWDRVVVFNNFGAVPRPPGLGDGHAQKNFKLLLLNSNGRPTHVVSCADPSDKLTEREYRVVSTLSQLPEFRDVLPISSTASSESLRVLVTRFVAGTRFELVESRLDAHAWRSVVGQILQASAAVCAAAETTFPALVARQNSHITLRDEAEPDLAVLRDAGFPSSGLRIIETDLLESTPVPRVLQHGDLWGGNVLFHAGALRLLDFAELARVHVPMFDVFHFLTNSRRAPLSFTENAGRRGSAEETRAIAREQGKQFGLDSPQMAGAYIYYLTSFAAFKLRPGMMPEDRGNVFNLLQAIDLRKRNVDLGKWLTSLGASG